MRQLTKIFVQEGISISASNIEPEKLVASISASERVRTSSMATDLRAMVRADGKQ